MSSIVVRIAKNADSWLRKSKMTRCRKSSLIDAESGASLGVSTRETSHQQRLSRLPRIFACLQMHNAKHSGYINFNTEMSTIPISTKHSNRKSSAASFSTRFTARLAAVFRTQNQNKPLICLKSIHKDIRFSATL